MSAFITATAFGFAYAGIFFGVILLGGTVLIPAIYFAILGKIDLLLLFFTVLAAGIAADTFWYVIGRRARKRFVFRFVWNILGKEGTLSKIYAKHPFWTVFIAKFVFGTRIASQLLAGFNKMSYLKFLGGTATGTILWFSLFYVFMYVAGTGVEATRLAGLRLQFTVAGGVAALVAFFFIGKYAKRRWLSYPDA